MTQIAERNSFKGERFIWAQSFREYHSMIRGVVRPNDLAEILLGQWPHLYMVVGTEMLLGQWLHPFMVVGTGMLLDQWPHPSMAVGAEMLLGQGPHPSMVVGAKTLPLKNPSLPTYFHQLGFTSRSQNLPK